MYFNFLYDILSYITCINQYHVQIFISHHNFSGITGDDDNHISTTITKGPSVSVCSSFLFVFKINSVYLVFKLIRLL